MTRIRTPFGAGTSAAEIVDGIDLGGRRAVVTGGASGIGVETARALAGAGAEVVLAVRDLAAGERVAEDLIAGTGNKHVTVARLDLADRDSVAAFAAGWDGPLHILVNNAGVTGGPLIRTPQGWERQFAVNHLGHFALASALRGALAAAGGARVVAVSSAAHLRSPVVFDDIHFQQRAYDPWLAHGQSKTANVLFAVEANRRWGGDRITVNALHPGDGAATSVLLAASPLVEGIGGRYFEDCNEAAPHVPGTDTGVAAYAVDPDAARRLWRESLRVLA